MSQAQSIPSSRSRRRSRPVSTPSDRSCHEWSRTGKCQYENKCKFQHGEQDTRHITSSSSSSSTTTTTTTTATTTIATTTSSNEPSQPNQKRVKRVNQYVCLYVTNLVDCGWMYIPSTSAIVGVEPTSNSSCQSSSSSSSTTTTATSTDSSTSSHTTGWFRRQHTLSTLITTQLATACASYGYIRCKIHHNR